MARGRSGYGSSRRGTARRLTSWGAGPGSQSSLGVSASSNSFLGAGLVITSDEEVTIVRIRGLFRVLLTAATAVGDGFFGAVGIGIVATSAFDAGISSVPTPVTEVSWEGWLWHSFFGVHRSLGDGAPSESTDLVIDSKAMRKQNSDEVLYAAVELTEEGTATADLYLDARVLDKLP